jgi:aminopeptidase N
MRIHMLRHLLGDELFWKAVQSMFAQHTMHHSFVTERFNNQTHYF